MEVKEGYKRTELGALPEEWRVSSLHPLLQQDATYGVVTAGAFQRAGVPMVRGGDLKSGRISNEQPFITLQKSKEYARTILREWDVVIALVGYPGESAVVSLAHVGANISRAVGLLRPGADLDSKYLACYLNAPTGRREFLRPSAGSAQIVVNLAALNRLRIPLPTLSEQKAIAEALSDVDDLIASLERLIAKKCDIKTATMGQLLSGRTRLPGFTGEWERKRLGELGAFFKGRGVKKDETRSGELPCIRYGEIYTHHHDYIRSFNSWISRTVANSATPLRKGDLLFAGSGETKAEIGKCVAFLHDCEAYAGGDIVILRAIGVDSRFLGYQLNTPEIAAQKASYGQGDAVVHISAGSLAAIGTLVPRLAEQTAIAAVLSDMDAEIEALQARLDKTRMLKQGMMQELLTGRTRLV